MKTLLLTMVGVCSLGRTTPAEGPVSGRFTEADFARHVEKLKEKVPDDGFTIVVQPPFVVIGDEPAATVRAHAKNTVKWAVEKLKQEFFADDPEVILNIWLFKDKASYEKHTKKLFGDEPTTPFGYYSRAHRAIIMNIGTGGGTLVHEIVHPFVEANFPDCPAWFNEGLGSLYEQCGEKNGRIAGYTNWRLAGLKNAINAGTVPSFETLTALSSHKFYTQDRGTNYSQARYLCYYLQEQLVLAKFYREFRANRKDDPTGFKTLSQVLGEEITEEFQKKWESFVLQLKFP